MNSESNPILGISACLLGAKVRHDGGAFTHHWLSDELSKFVQYENFCPEVAMGLGTPRETLRLVYDKATEQISLYAPKSKTDYTSKASETAKRIFADLNHLSGFILAKGSPSCGVEAVKLYNKKNDIPDTKGRGFFAQWLKDKYPFLPVVDSGRMHNPVEREKFIKYMMSYHRLKNLTPKISALQLFHQRHKYMLMEHSPGQVSDLGKIAGNSQKLDFGEVYLNYITLFSEVMRKDPTIKTRKNVFFHLLGYFKNDLETVEKDHFLEIVEDYSHGRTPYITLVNFLNLLIKKYKKEYLRDQFYLNPYPLELGLQKFVE
ncbi:MAG: DUF523 and DUF1722 domain-containing protein [Bdellovibrio sp.]